MKLTELLDESAYAAYRLIEQTRKLVREKHEQSGASLNDCVEELHGDFVSAMEATLSSCLRKHGVSDQQRNAAIMIHQHEPGVQAALTALREAMDGKPPPGHEVNAEQSGDRTGERPPVSNISDAPIAKESLLQILNKSAEQSRAVFEKIHIDANRMKEERQLSDEQALCIVRTNAEQGLDELIKTICAEMHVSQTALEECFKLHQADSEVQQVIQQLRQLFFESGPATLANSAPTIIDTSGTA